MQVRKGVCWHVEVGKKQEETAIGWTHKNDDSDMPGYLSAWSLEV